MKKELVVILGAGESGVGAARLAVDKGFDVWVSDYSEIILKYKEELLLNNIPFEEKGHDFEKIENAKWVVKSPGISEKAEVIKFLRKKGVTIISEIEFASMFNSATIVAITGSNGKTTVSSLVFHLLMESGRSVVLGGNIGTGFSRLLADKAEFEIVVLELSSFQLDDIIAFRPDIAVILNITSDHLDRYDYQMENYARAKWNISKNMTEKDLMILNQDDAWIAKMNNGVGTISKLVWLSANDPTVSLKSKDFKHNLKGRHNDFNVSVAIEIAAALKVDNQAIRKSLMSFQAIEHRLESVALINGVEFINDSKATNVDAVMYALDAMDKPVIWIAGGTDKGNDYTEIFDLVRTKVRLLVCMGVDNSKLIDAFCEIVPELKSTSSISEAVKTAFDFANRGDVIILSPACASFDLFKNYENRGELFKNEVFKLID